MRQSFPALQSPNFRLWLAGQSLSTLGGLMQATAQGYLVYELTGSSAYLGIVSFLSGLPTLVIGMMAGVLGDRVSRKKLLIVTQALMMLLSVAMAALVFSGAVQPWHILVMSLLLGIAHAFDGPNRQAFVTSLVSREITTNAIALNSTVYNIALVLGPTVGALFYALVGPGWCYFLNGISFLTVLASLFRIRVEEAPAPATRRSPREDLKEGMDFLKANPLVAILSIQVGLMNIFGWSPVIIAPAWAVKVLGGDVTTNGILLSARGVGAVVATLLVAVLGHKNIKGRLVSWGLLIVGLTWLVFSQVTWLPLSLVLMACSGLGIMFSFNTSNALMQIHTPDHLRGRVMSTYMVMIHGTNPIAALLMGGLAASLGEQAAVAIAGASLLVVWAILYWRVPGLRRMG